MLLLCHYIEKRKRKRQAVVSFLIKSTDPLQESIALCPDDHSWVLSPKTIAQWLWTSAQAGKWGRHEHSFQHCLEPSFRLSLTSSTYIYSSISVSTV